MLNTIGTPKLFFALNRCVHSQNISHWIDGGFLLSIALTCPGLVLQTTLVGHPGNDTWNHVWGYWWVSKNCCRVVTYTSGWTAFLGEGHFILSTQFRFYSPSNPLTRPAAAFNCIMLGELALAGVGAWLLAYKVTSDMWASFAALFLFEMSAHLMGQSYNGISETVCAGWFPMTLWALIRMMERPSFRRALILGVLGSMCVLTSWYYGLFSIIGSLLILRSLETVWLYNMKDVFHMF